ncbi:glycoside hydrolase family 18 protein [Bacillus ndiopicus]|uniref:glycoside hydrolase family 18 protein n=1 Tax=Bacillus ndiopicus TaxID=1347368 RepID=UPI0005A6B980|nr:glycoside hydrolase family 18 protein [Bacillus ndiopicus]
MQIHVVRAGENLWSIAQGYGTTVNVIVQANQIPEPDQLVIGQALVIPIYGNFYTVRAGDSLWSIAQKFQMNYLTLAQINGINPNQTLPIGLRLYIPPRAKSNTEALAYIEPRGNTVSEAVLNQAREASPSLTYLALFSFEAQRDGSVKAPPVGEIPAIARQSGTVMSLVVTNLENGDFSGELAQDILQSSAVQERLLNNILAEAQRIGNVRDIHFDFEALPESQRVAYVQFLRRAVEKFHPAGYFVSAALAPKVSDAGQGPWQVAHDYGAIGEVVDFVVLMTYEWGYITGPPMAVSPINEVERVLNYALTKMPASKIMMGQNLYGYDWPLPFVQGQTRATALSPQRAIELAKRYHAAIQYDTTAQAPYFHYVNQEGQSHVVWFEDARSIQAKFDLMKRLNIRGIAYWRLGLPFPQNWLLLTDNFNIQKR